jgi:hypothetical protein
MGDLSGHYGRQRRDNDHEDDQPDSDAEDLPSNRRPYHGLAPLPAVSKQMKENVSPAPILQWAEAGCKDAALTQG